MDELKLIEPSVKYRDDIVAFRKEIESVQDVDSFAGCGSLRMCETVEGWLETLRNRKSAETCPNGGVPSDTYLAVRCTDDRIVGMIDLRHHINHPVLGLWGGHMGYSVRPSERGKGYAREMLRLNLENCKARNMEKILVTCSEGNKASEKTILANGGVFEKSVCVDGKTIKRFWIEV